MKDKMNVIVVFGSKILIAILGVVLLSLETKYISPEVLGEYSLFSGIINAGVTFCVSWVGSSALRYYDSNKDNLSSFNSTVTFGGILSTIVLVLVVSLIGLLSPKLHILKYYWFVVGILIFKSGHEILEKILRASANFFVYSFFTIFQYVINVVLFAYLAKNNPDDLSSVLIALIVSLVLFDIASFLVSKSYKGISVRNIDSRMNKVFLNYGIPMIGTWAISWLLNYADRYMINFFYTSKEVGYYTTAYTISQSSLGLFTTSITITFFPLLIKKWNNQGKEAVLTYTKKILEYYLLFIIPAAVGLVMVSKYFYGTLLDARYLPGYTVIALSSFGFMFLGINNILYKIWQLEEKTKRILYLMVLSLIVNIITNGIFLPLFGFVAAAYTTIFSYLLIFTIAFIWIRRDFEISVNPILLIKTLIACVPMCILLRVFEQYMYTLAGLVFAIVVSGTIYLLVQLLLGNFSDERELMINYLKRRK